MRSFGLTLEDIPPVIRPLPAVHDWGTTVECSAKPQYRLQRIDLNAGSVQPLHFFLDTRGTYLVEQGRVLARTVSRHGIPSVIGLAPGEILHFTAGEVHGLGAAESAVVYLFANRSLDDDCFWVESSEAASEIHSRVSVLAQKAAPTPAAPLDHREAYWGDIDTYVNDGFAGKRIVMRAGAQSSLEFHTRKVETYYVHSGLLKVGLRAGRGQNTSVVLAPGEVFEIDPGLMHMRIGLEDTVIIEISTEDIDTDSHLVEDGRTYRHVEALEQ